MKVHQHRAIILTMYAATLRKEEVLGTGGWLPAADRESLDWMTLIASLGWECVLLQPTEILNEPSHLKDVTWVILCKDLEDFSGDKRSELIKQLATYPLIVIENPNSDFNQLRVGECNSRFENCATGYKVRYRLKNRYKEWELRDSFVCDSFTSSITGEPMLWLEDAVIAIRNYVGVAKFINLSFHSGEARDSQGVFSAIMKEIMITECFVPVVWYEWANTLLLRMDDPGSSQRIYDKKIKARVLKMDEWAAIGKVLRECGARLSVGYVPAWVDDGDSTNSKLTVRGENVDRSPGILHPSPYVLYERIGPAPSHIDVFDFGEEFRTMQELIQEGIVSTELHGYTHLFPDVRSWLASDDRSINSSWFREFSRKAMLYTESLPQEERPLEKGIQLFSELFFRKPSTMIFPGEEFTLEAVRAAKRRGIRLIGSYYLAMPVGDQLCWNHHICSPYLDRAASSFFDHALPVVGYFHDFDVAQKGIEWFSRCLEEWVKKGARYFIDYANLADSLSTRLTLQEKEGGYVLLRKAKCKCVFGGSSPVRIGMYLPVSDSRRELEMYTGEEELYLPKQDFELFQS